MTCTHIALLGSNINICNESILEIITERFLKNINSIRLKDIERICYVLSKFDFVSESKIEIEWFKTVLLELPNRIDETKRFIRLLPNCLRCLAQRGFYCNQLLSKVLSKEFLKTTYDTPAGYAKEILFLDSFVKINLRNVYEGPQLSDEERAVVASKFCKPVVSNTMTGGQSHTTQLDVWKTIKEVYQHPKFAHALPHFSKSGWIICLLQTDS